MRRAESDPAVSRRDPFWLVLLILFPLLVFPNLGNIYLWQDEGETAILARCVLLHGYPLAHDGTQVVSDQVDHRDLKDGVWIWTPWLPIYVAASAFAVFGQSTWAARLPFALAAWGALLLSYAAFLELTRRRGVSRLACLFLATSVPFLLHARQCRYYSLLVLFALVHLWGYARILRGARFGAAMVAVAGAGLAQTFLPQLVASTAALGAHALFVARGREAVKRFFLASAVVALVSLPFFLYTASWSRDYEDTGHGFDSPGRFMAALRSYVLMLHAYLFPFFLLVPLAWRSLGAQPKPRARVARAGLLLLALLALFGLGTAPGLPSFAASWAALAVMVLWGLAALAGTRKGSEPADDWRPMLGLVVAATLVTSAALCPYPFFRYLLGILPVAALFTAYAAAELAGGNRIALTAVAALLIGTNLISQGPFVGLGRLQAPRGSDGNSWLDRAMRYGHGPSNLPAVNVSRFAPSIQPWSVSPLADYLGEVTHDYDGPLEAVVRQIRASGAPGQVMMTTYEHFPLMFYTELTVLKPYEAERLSKLPDWVFLHGGSVPRLPPAIASALGTGYEQIKIPVKDLNWENIPEPYWHFYRTRRDGRDAMLFRKRPGSATP